MPQHAGGDHQARNDEEAAANTEHGTDAKAHREQARHSIYLAAPSVR